MKEVPMKEPPMKKPVVFISYSSKDRPWVKDYLVANLEKNGIRCHIDYRDFEIGKPSLYNMEEAVEKCVKTILVFTPDWLDSEFGQLESLMLQLDSPVNFNKKMLPIMLKKCNLPRRLKIFTYAHFMDENEWDEQLKRVIKQIKDDFRDEPEQPVYPALDPRYVDRRRLPETGYELFGRSKELTLLDEAWESENHNVVCFKAYGGVGKSTLVNKWVEKMSWDNYRGAERVYAWSFYSQGTKERVTAADTFINAALQWFGDDAPEAGSPWDKGKRLAQLINRQKTLLILDGLEPLQSKAEQGKIKDAALGVLIKELAKHNSGLCVITSREHIPGLDRYPDRTIQCSLEQISVDAGKKLLHIRRIRGTETELEQTVRTFGGHALAVNLLAEYLRLFPGHHIQKAAAVPDLDIPEDQGKHPRRVIDAFITHIGPDSPAYQLLSLLGLFDRPVPIAAIKAILTDDPIPGLTDLLPDTTGATWHTTIKQLHTYKLLADESEHSPNTLDCHPLIREHFAARLREGNPAAWKEAHTRLYEHYKNLPEKDLPDTIEEMEPLFTAVTHGCLAGKHQEALDDVYWERIRRKNEAYTIHKLGAFGADLACVSNFFETPWHTPAPDLTDGDKAAVLNWAGFGLRATGRLAEAAEPMKAAIENVIKLNDWKNAANGASSLSQLYLIAGDVPAAVDYGARSVTFADRSGDDFWKEASRITHADALHQAGDGEAAERLFAEAEAMQKERRPEYPYLYSLQGFQFCDLLLSRGRYAEVLDRARTTLEIAKEENWLLDIALNTLSIGKVLMLQAGTDDTAALAEAGEYLNRAVAGLRESGAQHRLPWGLLARAAFYRRQRDFDKAWADLDEVREIAEYGGMRLHLVDYHLEAGRLIKAQSAEKTGDSEDPGLGEHVDAARRLIEETGYRRRDAELAELDYQ